MKKIYLIMLTVFLNIGLYSCTPTSLIEAEQAPQACCDGQGDIPPPPPPTKGNGG